MTKVPCKTCGEMILPTTAANNDGLCMPCKGGYRNSMEESKKRYEREAAHRQTPTYRHWTWLVQQVHGDGLGFATLSEENKLFFAINTLIGEVYNGGFHQYFINSASDYYDKCIAGLHQIGAERSLALLVEAAKAIWGNEPVPKSRAARLEKLNDDSGLDASVLDRLDGLDRAFGKDEDGISSLASEYRVRHNLDYGF